MTTRRPWLGGNKASVHCEEAREAVSARLDGERSPLAGPVLELHLANCQECRDYEVTVADLARRTRLRAPRPAPDDLVATLVPLLEPVRPSLAGALRRRLQTAAASLGWAGTVGWAGAFVPVTLVVAAIFMGVGSHPHLVPTRPPSPCTIGLVARHSQHGG